MILCVRSQRDLNSEVVVCSTRGGRGLRNISVGGSKDLCCQASCFTISWADLSW